MTSKTERSQLDLSLDELRLTDLIDVEELQKMQDIFSDATGVAAIITTPSGDPIVITSYSIHYTKLYECPLSVTLSRNYVAMENGSCNIVRLEQTRQCL